MDNSYIEGPLKTFEDDYRRMMSSNDLIVDKIVDLSSLSVVDLDTTIVPDVFCLQAFDAKEPVARVLPGDFGNSVRVLVPDATATPVDFHDIILEDLSGMMDSRASRIVRNDVTSLKRQWRLFCSRLMHKFALCTVSPGISACGDRCEAVSGVRLPLGSPIPDLP